MEKVDKQQLNKLIEVMEDKQIKSKWILNICKIECLTEMSIWQYNYLLLILERINKEI